MTSPYLDYEQFAGQWLGQQMPGLARRQDYSQQLTNSATNFLATSLSGNPAIQNIAGRYLHKSISGIVDNFKGSSGGLYYGSGSLLDEFASQEVSKYQDQITDFADKGIADVDGLSNIFKRISGHSIYANKAGKGFNVREYGFRSMYGAENPSEIDAANQKIADNLGQLSERIAGDFFKDTANFGGLSGRGVNRLSSVLSSRGAFNKEVEGMVASEEDDDSSNIESVANKLKNAAKGLAAIRKFLSGSQKEMMEQITLFSGDANMNTDLGGATGIEASMQQVTRVATMAETAGVSTQAAIRTNITNRALIHAIGGDTNTAAVATEYGLAMFAASKTGSMSDIETSQLKSVINKMSVGAQQSDTSKQIAAAGSLLEADARKTFYERIQNIEGEVTLATIAKTANLDAGTIVDNMDSYGASDQMKISGHIGTSVAHRNSMQTYGKNLRANYRALLETNTDLSEGDITKHVEGMINAKTGRGAEQYLRDNDLNTAGISDALEVASIQAGYTKEEADETLKIYNNTKDVQAISEVKSNRSRVAADIKHRQFTSGMLGVFGALNDDEQDSFKNIAKAFAGSVSEGKYADLATSLVGNKKNLKTFKAKIDEVIKDQDLSEKEGGVLSKKILTQSLNPENYATFSEMLKDAGDVSKMDQLIAKAMEVEYGTFGAALGDKQTDGEISGIDADKQATVDERNQQRVDVYKNDILNSITNVQTKSKVTAALKTATTSKEMLKTMQGLADDGVVDSLSKKTVDTLNSGTEGVSEKINGFLQKITELMTGAGIPVIDKGGG